MRDDVCKQLHKVRTPTHRLLRGADTDIIRPSSVCTARISIGDSLHHVQFVVLTKCIAPIILGWDFLQSHDALIDCGLHELQLSDQYFENTDASPAAVKLCLISDMELPPKTTSLVQVSPSSNISGDVLFEASNPTLIKTGLLLPYAIATIENGTGWITVDNINPHTVVLPKGQSLGFAEKMCSSKMSISSSQDTHILNTSPDSLLATTISPSLHPNQKQQLISVLNSFTDVFDTSLTTFGQCLTAEHRIPTEPGNIVRHRPYRVSLSERKAIEAHVAEMLSKDVIRPSSSPWSSPVILVKKRDGTMRFCVDYRRLNKLTTKDVYPMPRIDDALDTLAGSSFFSSLDMRSGYWQIPVAEHDKPKTAFATPDGLYEFNVMPFGLCNAPATFERMIDTVLRGLKWKTCLCYLDDIIIFSRDFDDHLTRLTEILSSLRNAGLKLNTQKCRFAAHEVKVLGHIVNAKGISPDPEKIQAVANFPTPQNIKQLQSFIGLCSYFRRFVYNFAQIASPLHSLLQKDTPFRWSTECQRAFTLLQSLLIAPPILRHFDPSATTIIHTDASSFGIGAVLLQRPKHSHEEQVIAYASRSLSKPERNYSTTEREALAIVWAIGKFRPYVYGRPFEVVTDHHSLCWLTSLKDLTGRLGRWALKLQQYDFHIVYKSGRKHLDADALSRCPLPDSINLEPLENNILASLAPISRDTLPSDQRKDAWINRIMSHLDGSQPSNNRRFINKTKQFSIIDGMLFRRNYDPQGRHWLLVVPQHLRQEILQQLHDDPTSGHLGFLKTYTRVRNRFFWPAMYRTIFKYVRGCHLCQIRKRSTSPPSGLLQPLTPPHSPFEVVGIDLLGPLPMSASQNNWIIVAIDHLTRYVETKALATATAPDVATFLLNQILLRHGAPRILISDRGSSFMSSTIEALLNASNITHRTTTAYHPQTNGLTERLHHTLADMISMYISESHTNWDTILPFITFAYNTAVQSTTGFSPFHLLYGQEASCNLDSIFHSEQLSPSQNSEQFLAQALSHTQECRRLARLRTAQQQRQSKERYDKTHRDVTYSAGDQVLVSFPLRKVGLCQKFLPRYLGPYTIVRQTSPVNYLVQHLHPKPDARAHNSDIVHVSRLKPYNAQ